MEEHQCDGDHSSTTQVITDKAQTVRIFKYLIRLLYPI